MNNQCLYVNILYGKSLGGVIHQIFGNLVGLFNIKIPTRLLDIKTRRLNLLSFSIQYMVVTHVPSF